MRVSASCSITGPYAKSTASEPSRSTRPRPGSSAPSSSMRRGDGPMASRIATRALGLLDRPAHERARLLRVRRLRDRHARQRAEQRDVADALVRLSRAGGDQPRVVQRVDDLRPLARLVVDLLVRARGEERRERVDDREEAVAGEAGRGRDHVLLGDAALEEALRVRELEGAHAAVGREVGVEDDEVARAARRARRAPRRRRRRRTRPSRSAVARPAPLSGSPCRGEACLALSPAAARRTTAGRARARRSPPRSARRARRAPARTARRRARPRASGRCRRRARARPGAP